MTRVSDKVQKVEQLQCTAWPDMEAPKETMALLDLYEFTEEILNNNPGGLLVHCSAGVGRTGTFLAVYKLWLDYINPNVKELSVFSTVLALRRQRCLMVQKKEQYAYIAKCLRFGRKIDQMSSNVFLQLSHQHRGRRLL